MDGMGWDGELEDGKRDEGMDGWMDSADQQAAFTMVQYS